MQAEDLTVARQSGSGLPEKIRFLLRVLNGEGSEGDMLNLIFMADLQDAFARAGWREVEIERAARLRTARL